MKKLILILAIVLPVLASAQKTAPQVIACVSSQEVLMLMPEIKTVTAKLDSLQTNYENILLNMQEEFNKKVAEFQQQQASLSETVRNFRQQELADLERRIQQFYGTIQQDLQAKQVEYMQPVQQKLLELNYDIFLGEPVLGKSYDEYDYKGNVAIVIGNERYGIDPKWYESKHKKVYIPMEGLMGSLNVSVAGSILLFEALKNRKK
jgi:outer membrane protein